MNLTAGLPAILQRCESGLLAELPQEVSKVGKSTFQTDVRDRLCTVTEQGTGPTNTICVYIGHRRLSNGFFKHPAEVLFVQAEKTGEVRGRRYAPYSVYVYKKGFVSDPRYSDHVTAALM